MNSYSTVSQELRRTTIPSLKYACIIRFHVNAERTDGQLLMYSIMHMLYGCLRNSILHVS